MALIKGFCILLLCQFLGEVTGRALLLPVPGPVLGMLFLLLGLMLRGRLRKRLLPAPDIEGEGVLRVDENTDRDLGQRQLARALLRERVPASLRLASNGLLSHLSLLFVPAGVGVMVHFELIARDLTAIAITLVASIAVTQFVTAWLLQHLIDRGSATPSGAGGKSPSADEVSS